MRRIRLSPRFFMIGIAVVFLYIGLSFGYSRLRLHEGAARLAEKRAERDAMVSEIGALQSAIDFAQTDAYVERVARDELGLIMPGEIRYVSN